MTINEAITKAVEGGWRPSPVYPDLVSIEYWGAVFSGPKSGEEDVTIEEMLLDPIWWQALGKSLGWGITKMEMMACGSGCETSLLNLGGDDEERADHQYCSLHGTKWEKVKREVKIENAWEFKQIEFVQHIQSGKSIQEYFASLTL